MDKGRNISSFSVLLLMAAAAVMGLACFPKLKLQYTPSVATKEITVSYSYPGASARIVEGQVTSKLEGVLSTIRSCAGISSHSDENGGYIKLETSRRANLEAVRFEVASLIRNAYPKLPEGCSYPSISLNTKGEKPQTAIAYRISGTLPSQEIASFVEREMLYPLSTIEGVNGVGFYGQTPFEWVITFDADRAAALGITANQLKFAISSFYEERIVGMTQKEGRVYSVRLHSVGADTDMDRDHLAAIPVGLVNDRVIHLGDLASFSFQEALPNTYYRVNGLNVLMVLIEVSSDANLLGVVKDIKKEVEALQKGFPDEIGVSVAYDYSEYIEAELHKIYLRTLLCLLILLFFVFLMSRSWQYMLVIAITLAANVLLSVTLYYFLGLQIHIYTLAGVTVSLGIIIDNSIVMIDHYARMRDRKVFSSLLCAVMTTVTALLVVLLMPEEERVNLTDFTLVIIINLCVSLGVAYLFIPALMEQIPISVRPSRIKRSRRIAGYKVKYEGYIDRGMRHKWIYLFVLVALFGIPTCLIPSSIGEGDEVPLKRYEKILNKIIGWRPYANNKTNVDKVLSSSFGLFYEAMSRSDFYREPTRSSLYIRAAMPEGCSVQQLNEVMRSMENYLAHFDEIDVFETRISSYNDGIIGILFKPEFEGTWLPLRIKSDIIAMANNFGGANWNVFGLDESSFNNNVLTDYRSESITLVGYNFDELSSYAEQLIAYLETNRRVSQAVLWGSGYDDSPITEFNIQYDFEALNASGISPYLYYSALKSPLYNVPVLDLPYDGKYVPVRLASSAKDKFDLWHINNSAVLINSEQKMKLSEVGEITKIKTGIPISKKNQNYAITVRFNFIGSRTLSQRAVSDAVDYMNNQVLPIGFRAEDQFRGWFYKEKEKFAWLILLVVAIIFVICTIHFNSVRQPLAVILMIPFSFIGLFLVFGLSDFPFDKGGFASFVMLSGITVNAGIYLISEYRLIHNRRPSHAYLQAFERKIRPISLTILSTIFGLIPFLLDGSGEVFWFSFAMGTIAGLLFSILALLFFLPVFVIQPREENKMVAPLK